jgi:hypothetical protein
MTMRMSQGLAQARQAGRNTDAAARESAAAGCNARVSAGAAVARHVDTLYRAALLRAT